MFTQNFVMNICQAHRAVVPTPAFSKINSDQCLLLARQRKRGWLAWRHEREEREPTAYIGAHRVQRLNARQMLCNYFSCRAEPCIVAAAYVDNLIRIQHFGVWYPIINKSPFVRLLINMHGPIRVWVASNKSAVHISHTLTHIIMNGLVDGPELWPKSRCGWAASLPKIVCTRKISNRIVIFYRTSRMEAIAHSAKP